MEKDARIAQNVRSVIQRKVPWHPGGRRDEIIILGDLLLVMPVKIGDVDLARRPIVHFECDSGLADRFAAKLLNEFINKRVGLAAKRSAGVSFGEHLLFRNVIRYPAFKVAIILSRKRILSCFSVGVSEALDK